MVRILLQYSYHYSHKKIFLFTDEDVIMVGSLSPRMAVIFFRVAAVAVAVRAITEILEGIRL